MTTSAVNEKTVYCAPERIMGNVTVESANASKDGLAKIVGALLSP